MSNSQNDFVLSLMDKGVIVKITLNRWSSSISANQDIFDPRLDAKANKLIKKYIVPGNYKIFPTRISDKLSLIIQNARLNLNYYSFDTAWGQFVPYSVFGDWKKANELLREDYKKLILEIGTNYNSIIAEVKDNYKEIAKIAWKKIYPDDSAGATISFITDFVDKVISSIPTKTEIVSKFNYRVTYLTIPMASLIKNDNTTETVKHQIVEEYKDKMEELTSEFWINTVKHLESELSETCKYLVEFIQKHPYNKGAQVIVLDRVKKNINRFRGLIFYGDTDILKLLNDLYNELNVVSRNDDLLKSKLEKIINYGGFSIR